MVRVFSTILFLIVSSLLHAQTQKLKVEDAFNEPHVLEFFDAIYSMNFTDAHDVLGKIEADGFIYNFLQANYHWWMLISEGESVEHVETCYQYLELSLESLNKKGNQLDSSASHFGRLLTHAIYARIALHNSQYIKALNSARKIANEIEKSISFSKVDDYNKLPSGIYLYAAYWSEKHYPLLSYPVLIFIPDGDKTKGIEYLKMINNSENNLLRTESIYFLMKIYNEGEEAPDIARIYAKKLLELYPENLIYRAYYISMLSDLNMEEEVATESKKYYDLLQSNLNLNSKQKENFNSLLNFD